ncbi:transcriptional regulator [Dokdonella sp.]|uniref:winged helix-turn-helix domain-containing protein n=1 Tax=Dokdonella sp. TaxID=2291710 RepID=UPI002636BFE0|nr:transcriptional regulator [Dokdonella sp.]
MDLGNAEATGYRFGDVEVDARRRRVLRNDAELALEPKAYGVLVELLRKAGDVVARDTLLDAVWGHRHVTPAVLNRIVAILRRELGDDAEHPRWIRTVHGVGYEFIGSLETSAEEPVPATASISAPSPAAWPVPPPSTPSSQRALRAISWLLAALAVVAAVASWTLWTRAPTAAPIAAAAPERGVAVLPLVNAINYQE